MSGRIDISIIVYFGCQLAQFLFLAKCEVRAEEACYGKCSVIISEWKVGSCCSVKTLEEGTRHK